MTQMLAELCYDPDTGRGDPVKLQAALKLTFYQIRHILCAPRDQEGKLIVETKTEGPTAEETFTQSWLRRGLPRWRIARKWQETLEAGQEEALRNGRY
jgi:hypothetical protein